MKAKIQESPIRAKALSICDVNLHVRLAEAALDPDSWCGGVSFVEGAVFSQLQHSVELV